LAAACFPKQVLKPPQVPDNGEVGVCGYVCYVGEGARSKAAKEQLATLFRFALERGQAGKII